MKVILFGVRSPLVVDYEESAHRLGAEVVAGISVEGAPRMLSPSLAIPVDQIPDSIRSVGFLACAFSPMRRQELSAMAAQYSLRASQPLIDPSAILPRSMRVGTGTFINAGVVVGGASFVGDHVLLNRAASLGHHCLLSDFVSVGPGVTLAGNIKVGERTIIGAGATILPDLRIGADAVIGAGAVVRKDVADGIFVTGNPAKERRLIKTHTRIHHSGEE